MEHLHADEFLVADVTTVEGTDTVIGHVSGNGGADIIVHVAGGGASAPSGGFGRSPQSYGTTPCSSTSSEQYDSIAA